MKRSRIWHVNLFTEQPSGVQTIPGSPRVGYEKVCRAYFVMRTWPKFENKKSFHHHSSSSYCHSYLFALTYSHITVVDFV